MSHERITKAEVRLDVYRGDWSIESLMVSLHSTMLSQHLAKPTEITFEPNAFIVTLYANDASALMLKDTINNGALSRWKKSFVITNPITLGGGHMG